MSNELGKFIKEKRGKKSLRDFATLIGISHSHLGSIEKGIDPKTGKQVSVSVDVLKKLADATKTDYYYLSELYFYDLEYADLIDSIENNNINDEIELKDKIIKNIPNQDKYKKILIDKGLMNTDGTIDEENFIKLIDFAAANKEFIINKKD